MMRIVAVRVGALLAAVVAALLITWQPAAAAENSPTLAGSGAALSAPGAPIPDGGWGAGQGAPASTAACPSDSAGTAADSNWLTINRWGDVADSFHDQLDADFWNDIFEKIQRRMMFSTMLNVGNSMWQLTANLTSFATRFCLLDTVGGDVDSVTGSFGKALFRGGVVTALAAAAVIVVLWRTVRRGGGEWRTLIRPGIVLGLMVLMINGATNSTQDTPGTWSPWWVAVKVDKALSTLAALPLQALNSSSASGGGLRSSGDHGQTDCDTYLDNMKLEYELSFAGGSDQMIAAVPQQISHMWEQTGLATWIKAQYGADNDYGTKVYCRTLENRVRTPVGSPDDSPQDNTRLGLSDGSEIPGANGGARAWNFVNDAHLEDASIVGWAACVYDGDAWSVDPEWAKMHSGGEAGGGGTPTGDGPQVTPESCEKWWTSTDEDVRNRDSYADLGMLYHDDPGYISAESTDVGAPKVGDFMLNWHGDATATAFALSLTFDIAALVVLLVFGGISVGIILGKVALIAMVSLILFVMLRALVPSREPSSSLGHYVRTYLGTSILVVGVSALFSLIQMMTGYLSKASTKIGPDSLLGVLWFGFAPVLAIVLLHMLFKHALKLPSPFKVSGALAWGAAAGGIGMAAASGVENMTRRASEPLRSFMKGHGWRTRRQGVDVPADEESGAGQKMHAEQIHEKKENGGDPIGGHSMAKPSALPEPGKVSLNKKDAEGPSSMEKKTADAGGGADQRMTVEKPKSPKDDDDDVSRPSPPDGGMPARAAGDDAPTAEGDPADRMRADRNMVRSGAHLDDGWADRKVGAAQTRRADRVAAADASGLWRDRMRAAKAGAVLVAARSGQVVSRRGRAAVGEMSAAVKIRGGQIGSRVADRARTALTWTKEHKAKAALMAAGGVLAAGALPIGAIVGGLGGVAGAVGGAAAGAAGVLAGGSHVATTALASYAVRRLQRREERRHPDRVEDRRQQRAERYAQLAAQARDRQARMEGSGEPVTPPVSAGGGDGQANRPVVAQERSEPGSGAEQRMGADSFRWAEPVEPALSGRTFRDDTDEMVRATRAGTPPPPPGSVGGLEITPHRADTAAPPPSGTGQTLSAPTPPSPVPPEGPAPAPGPGPQGPGGSAVSGPEDQAGGPDVVPPRPPVVGDLDAGGGERLRPERGEP